MRKSYKRFNNPKHSQGLFHRLCRDSLPTKNTSKGKIKPSSGRTCITESERSTREGCHEGENSLQGPVCQPSVPSIKKEWRATPSDQPERFEHIHTLQTFQDGRAPSVERNSGTRRLSMQVGPQRRLFLCPIEQTIKEICTFRKGRFPVRNPLSVFLDLVQSQGCYKINKSASLHPSHIVYKNNSIPRRFSNTKENFGGNNLKQGYCDLLVTESRICYKLKEISSSPNSENRILGDDHRLSRDDSVPASEEGRVDFQKVSGYNVNAEVGNKSPCKAFGNIIINSISISSCTTIHGVPAETTNSQPLFEKRL